MKTIKLFNQLAFMLIAALFTILIGCSSTGSTGATVQTSELGFTSLLDMLRREPNLNIIGSGYNATVLLRGNRSVEGNNEPLFEVDGWLFACRIPTTKHQTPCGKPLIPNAVKYGFVFVEPLILSVSLPLHPM